MENFANILIHFIGIGGIGMSGIAEVLQTMGCRVQGSDIKENPHTLRLRSLGVSIFIGHDVSYLEKVDVVVISTDICEDNKELQEARKRKLPVVHRSEMLAELMRLKSAVAIAGTHGKTTTTSLVACLFEGAGLDPTVINGGILNAYGTNARRGQGEWVIAEADESDGSFTRLPATIAVVTNIDPEHMNHYGTEEKLHEAFRIFVSQIPFYGVGILCLDHPVVATLIEKIQDRRLVTYGFSEEAHVRGVRVTLKEQGMEFDVEIKTHGYPPYSPERGKSLSLRENRDLLLEKIFLPMVGLHNVQNALAAISVALQMGIPASSIRQSLSHFSGVRRRFTQTGVVQGVHVIDDYGHHPVEIQAVLKAARSLCPNKKVIAVFQPHRYSRVADLMEEFTHSFQEADHVIVAPIYGAGEINHWGVCHQDLQAGIQKAGHPSALLMEEPVELASLVNSLAGDGDYVICLGAGSVTEWAQALPAQLQKLHHSRAG